MAGSVCARICKAAGGRSGDGSARRRCPPELRVVSARCSRNRAQICKMPPGKKMRRQGVGGDSRRASRFSALGIFNALAQKRNSLPNSLPKTLPTTPE